MRKGIKLLAAVFVVALFTSYHPVADPDSSGTPVDMVQSDGLL